MSDDFVRSVSVTREIDAPAADIFAVLANPAQHARIDGTGMAQSAEGDGVLSAVGDLFVIRMRHWSLGDYGMENRVVAFERDRLIVWEPVAHTYQSPSWDEMLKGASPRETRYWGWELEPLDATSTRVTEFYDGSRLSDGLRSFIRDGEFWRRGMEASLENLARLVTAPTTGPDDADAATESSAPRNYYDEVQRAD